LNRFKTIVNTILTITIDVMGINTRLPSERILMSPGSFPNQFKKLGAKWRIAPKTINMMPATTNQRAMDEFLW